MISGGLSIMGPLRVTRGHLRVRTHVDHRHRQKWGQVVTALVVSESGTDTFFGDGRTQCGSARNTPARGRAGRAPSVVATELPLPGTQQRLTAQCPAMATLSAAAFTEELLDRLTWPDLALLAHYSPPGPSDGRALSSTQVAMAVTRIGLKALVCAPARCRCSDCRVGASSGGI